ncbi:MAG: hypothetical protein WC619_02970 [Patescibacteria group bacterium]
MEILGYILYAILLFVTAVWMYGVRKKVDVMYPTVLGSIYFVIVSIIFPLYNINFLHILWVGPLIYISIITINTLFFIIKIPLIYDLLRFICDLYTSILRIGLDKNKIKHQQEKLDKEFVENYFKK